MEKCVDFPAEALSWGFRPQKSIFSILLSPSLFPPRAQAVHEDGPVACRVIPGKAEPATAAASED